jgi:protein TonB
VVKLPFAISVALHALLVAVLIWAAGRFIVRHAKSGQTVAVEFVSALKEPEPPKAADSPAPKGRRSASVQYKRPAAAKPVTTTAVVPAVAGPSIAVPENTGSGIIVPAVVAAGNETGPGSGGGSNTGPTGGSGGGAGGADYSKAAAEIRDRIEAVARRSYPQQARRLRVEGVVVVSFMISPGGEPSNIKIESSSGSEILDEAAQTIVRRAAPYPAFPEQLKIPIRFSLER